MRPGSSEREPAVRSGRKATPSEVSSAPGREAPVGRRTGPVSPGVRSRVSRMERQAPPPGASFHPRQGAAVADSRQALYGGGAQHSPDGFLSSVSGTAGRTVDTVRVGTTCASVGDSRHGRRGHDRGRQAAREGSGAGRVTICGARGLVGGAGRRRAGGWLAAAARPGSVLMRRRHGFGSRWHFSPAPEGGNEWVRHAAAQWSATGGGTMMERGAREALTSGAARSGPDGRSPPGRVRSAWSVSAAGPENSRPMAR